MDFFKEYGFLRRPLNTNTEDKKRNEKKFNRMLNEAQKNTNELISMHPEIIYTECV